MISIEHHFTASHAVASDSNSSELHPHDWVLTVFVDGWKCDRLGWVMDFADLRRLVAEVIPKGQTMNEWTGLEDATAEEIVDRLAYEIEQRLPDGRQLVRLALTEAPGNIAYWGRE